MKMAKSLWDGLLAIAVYNDSFYYVKNIRGYEKISVNKILL